MTDTIERPPLNINYATLRADNEELHELFEEGATKARAQLGHHFRTHQRPAAPRRG